MNASKHGIAAMAMATQVAVASGCYSGVFGEADAEVTDTGFPGGTGAGEPGPGPNPDESAGSDGGEPVAESEPQPLPLRRLSHTEYNNTVRDLFPHLDVPRFDLRPDPKPHSFDNDGTALVPSGLLVEQYADAADIIAEMAAADLEALVACDPDNDPDCSRQFVASFGRRVFRRPLADDEVDRFHRLFEQAPGDVDFAAGVELTIALMLQSPQFLYRVELPAEGAESGQESELDDYRIASRLSYFLWGSMPDDALFAAAAADELGSPEARALQAWRMLDDPRAQAGFWHFHRQWLHADRLQQTEKSGDFPQFDGALKSSMMTTTQRFVEDIIYAGDGTLVDLLTSNRAIIDPALAELYGVEAVDGWTEVELPSNQRAGLLSQPTFLAGHAHPKNPSPVLRGVWILKEMMCVKLGAPPPVPEAMDPVELEDGMTNRQVYDELTGAPECAGCHDSINNLGYALEHYDAIGAWRTQDNGLPVDASGSFAGMEYDGPRELAEALARNPLVASCVAQQWLRFAYGGDTVLENQRLVEDIEQSFAESGHDFKQLMVAIVTHPRFATLVVP